MNHNLFFLIGISVLFTLMLIVIPMGVEAKHKSSSRTTGTNSDISAPQQPETQLDQQQQTQQTPDCNGVDMNTAQCTQVCSDGSIIAKTSECPITQSSSSGSSSNGGSSSGRSSSSSTKHHSSSKITESNKEDIVSCITDNQTNVVMEAV
jgi:hypothetical protein